MEIYKIIEISIGTFFIVIPAIMALHKPPGTPLGLWYKNSKGYGLLILWGIAVLAMTIKA